MVCASRALLSARRIRIDLQRSAAFERRQVLGVSVLTCSGVHLSSAIKCSVYPDQPATLARTTGHLLFLEHRTIHAHFTLNQLLLLDTSRN